MTRSIDQARMINKGSAAKVVPQPIESISSPSLGEVESVESVSPHVRSSRDTVEEIGQFRLGNRSRIELPKNSDQGVSIIGGGKTMGPAVEAFKTLRNRLWNLQTSRGIRSVAVTSAAPADGKTTTTFNLACSMAQLQDTSVLLVDADLRTRALTSMIRKLPAAGLTDALSGAASYSDVVVGTDVRNLYLIGAGAHSESPAELLSGKRWADFMRWASESFKLVLVDSLPVGTMVDFDLTAAQCDGVLVVVRALKTQRENLQEALAQIDPKKMLGVVWNGDVQRRHPRSYYT